MAWAMKSVGTLCTGISSLPAFFQWLSMALVWEWVETTRSGCCSWMFCRTWGDRAALAFKTAVPTQEATGEPFRANWKPQRRRDGIFSETKPKKPFWALTSFGEETSRVSSSRACTLGNSLSAWVSDLAADRCPPVCEPCTSRILRGSAGSRWLSFSSRAGGKGELPVIFMA